MYGKILQGGNHEKAGVFDSLSGDIDIPYRVRAIKR
jgi:hypothetical protein